VGKCRVFEPTVRPCPRAVLSRSSVGRLSRANASRHLAARAVASNLGASSAAQNPTIAGGVNGAGALTFGAGPGTLSFTTTSKGRPGRPRALWRTGQRRDNVYCWARFRCHLSVRSTNPRMTARHPTRPVPEPRQQGRLWGNFGHCPRCLESSGWRCQFYGVADALAATSG